MDATTLLTRPPAQVRAMPGRCPVPLPLSLAGTPCELELLSWYFAVRQWGLQQKANGRPMFISKDAIVGWLATLLEDAEAAQDILTNITPEDPL